VEDKSSWHQLSQLPQLRKTICGWTGCREPPDPRAAKWVPGSVHRTVSVPRTAGSHFEGEVAAAAGYSLICASAASSRFHTSGRNCSSSSAGVVPIFARTLVRYRCGSRPCRSQLAISDQSRIPGRTKRRSRGLAAVREAARKDSSKISRLTQGRSRMK